MYGARAKAWGLREGQYRKLVHSLAGSENISPEVVANAGGSGIITERALSFRDMDNALQYANDQLSLSASALSRLPVEKVAAILSAVRDLYRELPALEGFIDEIVLVDMKEIAMSTLSWSGDKPKVLLKLSKGFFENKTLSEMDLFIKECVKNHTFTPKNGLYGVFMHEFAHFAEYRQTIKRFSGSTEKINASLASYELAKEIKELALHNCNLNNSNLKVVYSLLSEYACENPAEFVAEAFSCSDENNALANEVKRLLKRKWGI